MPQGPHLERPSTAHAASYVEALAEGFVRGTMAPASPERVAEIARDFGRFLAELTDQAGSIMLPGGRLVPKVPFTVFWLVDENGFIGELSLRHHLNEWLLQSGGHIGYGVRPSRRRQGLGRLMLRLAVPEARSRGIDRLLLTAHEPNTGSRRIIEANGGVLENIVDDMLGGGPLCRYWIDIAKRPQDLHHHPDAG
jgi:predicted acetyltransferase